LQKLAVGFARVTVHGYKHYDDFPAFQELLVSPGATRIDELGRRERLVDEGFRRIGRAGRLRRYDRFLFRLRARALNPVIEKEKAGAEHCDEKQQDNSD
jgi:hypothetical protein